jgi:transposase InsO family protein
MKITPFADVAPAGVNLAPTRRVTRSDHASWGAPKIREKIRRLHSEITLPAISTVHAVLDRNGLVTRRRKRRYKPEGRALSPAQQPNELWCADYKGEFMLAEKRYCYPLTVTDFASRYLISCRLEQAVGLVAASRDRHRAYQAGQTTAKRSSRAHAGAAS